jgi:predicted DsbA family dithiol-disulfide isomerase
MAQTIRLTITPDFEKALQILRQSTLGTLNTTELIKMAVGAFANKKKYEISLDEKEIKEETFMAAHQFYKWAKEDGSLEVDNIAHPEKLKPYIPKPYVRTS